MNRISIAVATICLVTSHLMAQSADVRGGNRNAYESRPVVDQTISSGPNLGVWQHLDGSVCFPPPYYDNCIYNLNSYSLDLYRLWILHTYWNGLAESDPPQPTYTSQSPEPPPPPPPPVTPVVHEYDWPKEVNTSATFSIVTNSGTVYLAKMVWVQEGNVHFNSVDGDVRQIPLSSISRALTQTANAQKNLNLRLPSAQAPTPDTEAPPEERPRSGLRPSGATAK